MSNLWLLIKVQFLGLLSRVGNGKSKKKVAGLGVLFLLGGVLMYMSVTYVMSMIFTFPKGYEYVSLYYMGAMTFIMLLVFGYQSAGGHLFGFKDYDLLMSLPVSKEEVLLSKFISFLVSVSNLLIVTTAGNL